MSKEVEDKITEIIHYCNELSKVGLTREQLLKYVEEALELERSRYVKDKLRGHPKLVVEMRKALIYGDERGDGREATFEVPKAREEAASEKQAGCSPSKGRRSRALSKRS